MKRFATLTLSLLAACVVPPASDPNYAGGGGENYAGDPNATGAGEEAPPPAGPVSVSIRSACPDTMRVFYGSDPKFGSGTHSTISSNSVSSYSFQPGDMFWITDDSDNGIASVTVSESTHQIEIDASCASLHEN